MKLKIEVRPQEGDSTNVCTLDPVAQALRKAVGLKRAGHPHGAKGIRPGTSRSDAMAQPSRLYASGPLGIVECETPKEVRDWILRWDETGEGEPFDFEVVARKQTGGYAARMEFQFPGMGHYQRNRPTS